MGERKTKCRPKPIVARHSDAGVQGPHIPRHPYMVGTARPRRKAIAGPRERRSTGTRPGEKALRD